MSATRTTKTITFSVPLTVAEEVEHLAKERHSTKSELFREMLRVFRSYHKRYPEPEIDYDEVTIENRLEQMLLDGLRSGPSIRMNSKEWKKLWAEADARIKKNKQRALDTITLVRE